MTRVPSITLYGPTTAVPSKRTKIREIVFLRAAYAAVYPGRPGLGLKAAKDAVDTWEPNEPRELPVLAGTEQVIRQAAQHANIQTSAPEFRTKVWLFDRTDDIPY